MDTKKNHDRAKKELGENQLFVTCLDIIVSKAKINEGINIILSFDIISSEFHKIEKS
tara:strand:+ start:400 stop:570 length:171 start_codon:yes stop_codon:yes gene_type:complete